MSRMWNLLAVVAITLAVPTMIAPAFADLESDAAFARARNAEIDASMARVKPCKPQSSRKNATPRSTPRWPRSPWFVAKSTPPGVEREGRRRFRPRAQRGD